jgi:hypothetical protein
MSKTRQNACFQISIRMRPLLLNIEDREIWKIDFETNTIISKSKKCFSSQLNQTNDMNTSNSRRRYADINYIYQFKFGFFKNFLIYIVFQDHIFGPQDSNELIYNTKCKSIVKSFLEGKNGSIFTYGQTTSGKTYTMLGEMKNPGLMPFALLDIFEERENVF